MVSEAIEYRRVCKVFQPYALYKNKNFEFLLQNSEYVTNCTYLVTSCFQFNSLFVSKDYTPRSSIVQTF
jgi:hypothetical protein